MSENNPFPFTPKLCTNSKNFLSNDIVEIAFVKVQIIQIAKLIKLLKDENLSWNQLSYKYPES